MVLTDAARMAIAEAGFDPDYGARPLRRVIQNRVQDPLSENLLAGKFAPGDTIQVDYRETVDEDGKTITDFVVDVIDHSPVKTPESEAAEVIEALLS